MGEKKLSVIGVIFVLGLGLFVAFPREVENEDKFLNVPGTKQEQSSWCWAACSSAVLSYFGKTIKQCYIADFAWARKDCCPKTVACNKDNSLYLKKRGVKDVLEHWCVNSAGVANASSFASCKAEIDAKRPFLIRYQWTLGGGHVFVVSGYSTGITGAEKMLYLMDPWRGTHHLYSYEDVKAEVDHTWSHTLKSLQMTNKAASWKATNTKPLATTFSGYPAWKYTIFLTEASGGCGQVVRMYCDFWGSSSGYIGRQNNTKEDFASWFDDCGDGDFQLPRVTKVCSKLTAHLGGETSGSIKMSFVIKCDKGNTITVSQNIMLPQGAASPGQKEGGGQPAMVVIKEER